MTLEHENVLDILMIFGHNVKIYNIAIATNIPVLFMIGFVV